MSSTQDNDIPLDPHERYYEDNEAVEKECTDEINEVIRQYIERRFHQGRRPALRDAHAKDTGLVKASFVVESQHLEQLEEAARRGVFASPNCYKAWIRFSNANCEHRSDRLCDARGMAIKLTGVSGPKLDDLDDDESGAQDTKRGDDERDTQDFILLDSPRFFGDDLRRYKATLEAFLTPWIIPQWLSVFRLGKWKEIKIAFKANKSIIENPLYCQYWSTTPYKLGDKIIKFTVIPETKSKSNRLKRLIKSFLPGFSLKHAMEKALYKERRFKFYVQFYQDDDSTPVEDTTVEWNSELIHVATIKIPPNQKLFSPERDAFCENLSFSPWHCLPEHRPLGATNRVRKTAYAKNSKHRHKLNRAPRVEPTGDETF